jgi:hypothetical protein
MICGRCKYPATQSINAGGIIYHLCDECANEIYARIAEKKIDRPTLGDMLDIRKHNAMQHFKRKWL